MMNYQKEKEAFEKHASKFFTTNEAFENDGKNYVYDEVKFMWDCWLAAKSQAVPEGFVLVEKMRLARVVDGIEALFEEDSSLALGELLPIQQDLNAMIDAQVVDHE